MSVKTALDPVANVELDGYAAKVESETSVAFEGPGGSLRISVEDYQFPEITEDDWDSNWLIIVGKAVLDGKSWSFRDACLTTFEIDRLADWLEQVSSGNIENAYCGFTEPNLEFERFSDAAIRISFSLEALPPWCEHGDNVGDIGLEVPIDDGLITAARNLRAFLTQFPIRARNGD